MVHGLGRSGIDVIAELDRDAIPSGAEADAVRAVNGRCNRLPRYAAVRGPYPIVAANRDAYLRCRKR
jgi:hypothetical protein